MTTAVDFPLVGEPLALDLLNTRPTVAGAPRDLLATPRELATWLVLESDRLRPRGVDVEGAEEGAPLAPTDADLAAVHAVRELVARLVGVARDAGPLDQADLHALNDLIRLAPAHRELVADPDDGTPRLVTVRPEGTLGARLSAALAEATAELLADPRVTTVRRCEADTCTLLFLPAHPRRRWCSPATCGNRVRVARHYERRRRPGTTA